MLWCYGLVCFNCGAVYISLNIITLDSNPSQSPVTHSWVRKKNDFTWLYLEPVGGHYTFTHTNMRKSIHAYMQWRTYTTTHTIQKKRVLVEQFLFHTWPVLRQMDNRLSAEEPLHSFKFHSFLLSLGCHLERWQGHARGGEEASRGAGRQGNAITMKKSVLCFWIYWLNCEWQLRTVRHVQKLSN